MNENSTGKTSFKIEHWMKIAFIVGIYDLVAVSASYFLALLLRFDFRFSTIKPEYVEAWTRFALVYAAACVIVFAAAGLYKMIWRFAGFNEFSKTLTASLAMSAFHVLATLLFYCRMPISYYIIGAVLQCILVLGIRFSYRIVLFFSNRNGKRSNDRIMLIGAGEAGQMILRDINNGKSNGRVVCIIDDNSNKWNRYVDGVRVVGGRESIL